MSGQPTPHGTGPDIADLVCRDIQARAALGEKKYGERLRANNGRNPLQDAFEEAADLCMYLRQRLEEERQVEGSRVSIMGYPTHDPTDARILELEADSARLRSLLGQFVEAVESYRKSGGYVMDAARLIELCEEARDAK
jgi:hypothetical protein